MCSPTCLRWDGHQHCLRSGGTPRGWKAPWVLVPGSSFWYSSLKSKGKKTQQPCVVTWQWYIQLFIRNRGVATTQTSTPQAFGGPFS